MTLKSYDRSPSTERAMLHEVLRNVARYYARMVVVTTAHAIPSGAGWPGRLRPQSFLFNDERNIAYDLPVRDRSQGVGAENAPTPIKFFDEIL